jgi:hypothetical protein
VTAQENAILGIAGALRRLRIPYMIIGGMANIVWGEPRATLDVDVTVWVEELQIAGFVETLRDDYRVLVEQPVAFIRETRVLPLENSDGVRIDVIFGLLSFEEEAIGRAVDVIVADARVKVCTAEDLILMKIVSDRDRDLADARGIVERRRLTLDRGYLEPRIRELARLLERPEIEARWHQWAGQKN